MRPRSIGQLGPRGAEVPLRPWNPALDGRSAGLIPRGTRHQGTWRTQAPSMARDELLPGPLLPWGLWDLSELDIKAAVYQDSMVPLPYRSRGDRTALGPWCRAAEARRDGMATLDAGWLDLRSRLVPRRSTRPGSLELRVHPETWRHQHQGIKVHRKLGLLAANADALARRQQERSAMVCCDPGARAGCMTMAPGNQGTKAPSGPSRPLRLGPNIAGSLARRGAFDMLVDDPPRFLAAAYTMRTWSVGTMGGSEAGKTSRARRGVPTGTSA
jgi:hypothetical protein